MGKQKSHLYIHNQTNLIMCLGFLVQQQERTNSRVLLDKSLESLLSLNKRFQLDFPSPKERRVFSVRGDDPIRPIPHTGATAHASLFRSLSSGFRLSFPIFFFVSLFTPRENRRNRHSTAQDH
jgi:hypothetical protein